MSLFDRFRRRGGPAPAWAPDSLLVAPLAQDGSAGQLQIGQGLCLRLAEPLQARQVQVDGDLHGSLRAGKLTVGRKGRVVGRLRCQQADVRGQVVGELVVKGRLTLYPSARIEGVVWCNDVVVWRGADLQAEVRDLPPQDPREAARSELAALNTVH